MEVLLLYFVRYVHGYMNLHHFATFLRITFSQNTSGWLLLDFFIHVTAKLIFAIHLPNTNYVFCILEHALSRLSNVMSIMVLAFGKITQRRRPIEAAVRVCSRETALKNFASCTGKHLFWDRFLIKCRPSTIPTQVFSCKNYRFFSVFTDPILLYIVTHQGIFFVIVIVFLIALLLFNGHKVQ